MTSKILAFCSLVFLGVFHAEADVSLATPFGDNMVLQSRKPLVIWGNAAPGEPIKVKFKGPAKFTKADNNGKWRLVLEPLPASAEPAVLTVAGPNTITITNVLVGEVWLCSGQSNMNHPLNGARDAAKEIAAANHPLIRYFEVESVVSDLPLLAADGTWKVSSPETAPRFTAVGYFFARELQREMKVPVGIIKATLGGSPIEGWMSARALADSGAAAKIAEDEWKPLVGDYRQRTDPYEARLADWNLRRSNALSSGEVFTEAKPAKKRRRAIAKSPQASTMALFARWSR